MFKRAQLFVQESFHRLWRRPRLKARYWQRSEPFFFTNGRGLRFLLHPGEFVDQYIAVEGIYERRFLDYYLSFLDRDAVVIDVGANIGNHALFLHRHVALIHAFEPNPIAADRLDANIALNDARNIVVHRVGLGDCDAKLPFFVNRSGNLGHSGFFEPAGCAETFDRLELPIRQADRAILALGLERLDFIKVDVEGHELLFFHALAETLARFAPVIAFEYHAHVLPAGTFSDYREALQGYVFAEISYAPEGSSWPRRLAYHLRHGDRKTLRSVKEPELRAYEQMLAIPSDHPLAQKID